MPHQAPLDILWDGLNFSVFLRRARQGDTGNTHFPWTQQSVLPATLQTQTQLTEGLVFKTSLPCYRNLQNSKGPNPCELKAGQPAPLLSLHTAEGMVPSLGASCELSTPWGWAHLQVCLTQIVRTGAPQETMRVCQGCAKHNVSGNICLRYVVVRQYNLSIVASSPSLYAGIDRHRMSEVLVRAH